jgi:hypothetical protein
MGYAGDEGEAETRMDECKHGMKTGCVYCHVPARPGAPAARAKRPGPTSRIADKMNQRMTDLKRRLRELRGE